MPPETHPCPVPRLAVGSLKPVPAVGFVGHNMAHKGARWIELGWWAWIEAPSLESWVFTRKAALADQAERLLQLCVHELPWHRPLFDSGKPWPRETVWLATEPCACSCTYGGHSFKPYPVPDWLTSF